MPVSADADRSLDDLVREHYRSERLSESRYAEILSSACLEKQRHQARRGRRHWLRVAAAAACLVLVAALLQRVTIRLDDSEALLDEIASYHLQPMEFDVVSGDLETVARTLNRLGFALRRPGFLPSNLQLLGGRYCSLRGDLAVQLKYRDPARDRIDTLFVTPATLTLDDISEGSARRLGVGIELREEDGLLFALARGTAEQPPSRTNAGNHFIR